MGLSDEAHCNGYFSPHYDDQRPCIRGAVKIVAIVEEIESVNAKLPYMDGVTPGTVIDLARNERLVLGYLASCIDETITGGSVVVGTTQSVVNGGTVSRVIGAVS